MAEAIAIFRVCAGTIGTADAMLKWIAIFRQTMKDFKEIGDTIHQLYRDFFVVQVRFKTWAEDYGLRSSTTTRTLEEKWGAPGSKSIEQQLISLYKVMDHFTAIIALLLSDEVLNILDPRVCYTGVRPAMLARKISEAGTISHKIKKRMTLEEKLDFFHFGRDDLSKDLEESERRVAFLQRDAEIFDKGRSKKRHKELTHDNVETNEIPELLRIAMETKGANSSLTNYIKLEMRLRNEFNNESEPSNTQSLHLHLLLTRPQIERPLEILVTGPIERIDSGGTSLEDDRRDFLGACEAVMNNDPYEFTASFGSQLLRFQSCLPRDLIHAEQQSFMPLSVLFQELQRDRATSFHLSEKVDLALRIAQYGLLLLGTSWLSRLRCSNIQRPKVSRGRQRFVLEAKAQASRFTSDPVALTGEQIFWIGILLAEVAIGQSILDLREDRAGGLELETTSFHHGLTPKLYPVAEILRQVHNTSTKKYAETVDFCLKKRQGAPHWRVLSRHTAGSFSIQNALMREYYNKVYKPLEALRGLF